MEVHILPNGLALYYLYDVLGHVVEKHFFLHKEPLAKKSFSYKGDLLIRYTDLEGHTTYYSYDGAGRKIREERCGHVSTYHYDRLANNLLMTKPCSTLGSIQLNGSISSWA